MKKTKLVTLLRTFTKEEMREFEKFISSPYFSPGRNLKPFYKALKKYYPEFDSPQFTEEKIFSIIYPDKKYEKLKSSHSLQVLFSEMTLLAEKFLAFQMLQNVDEGYMVNFALDEAFRAKNLMKYRMKVVLKNIEVLKKTDTTHIYFYHMFCENNRLQELFYHTSRQKAVECEHKLTLYMYGLTILMLSKLVNDYIIQSKYYKFNTVSKKLIEMGLNGFDPGVFEKECYDDGLGTKQLILTFYYIAKSQLIDEKDESLITAVKIFRDNFSKFKIGASYEIIFKILNICTDKMTKIDMYKYSVIGSSLIDFAFEKGIFDKLDHNLMDTSVYTSMFHLKLNITSYDVFKAFIDKWFEKSYPEDQKLFDYCYAWLSFKNNDYEKTLSHLSKFNIKGPLITDYSKRLRIASLYSLGHTEEAIYKLNSYEHYCQNSSNWTDRIKNDALIFIKSVRALIKFQTNSSSADENILNRITDDNRNSHFHSWFKEKVEELKRI